MVNHASVPRKLRSAMKKHSRAGNGVRLAGEEGKKKLKRQDDLEKVLITKDEEEAIATLIALAKMFPNNNKNNGYKCESTEAKSRPLVNDESAQETLEVKCSMVQSASLTTQPVYLKASCPTSRNFESEISMIANCKQLATEETAAAIGASVGSLHEGPFQMENCKIIGLWPGLSSAVSPGSDTKGSPMNSLGACNSTSMSLNALKTQSSSLKIGTLTDEDSRDPVFRNKSWKRCIAHVHIGRLIKGLQTTEETNNNPTQLLDQLTKIQRLKPNAHVDKSVSKIGFSISAAENNQNETRNANLLHKRLLQDQQQPSPTSTLYTSSNQSFDLLSMSTGGRGMEATKTVFETGNLIEPRPKFHIPYLQSIAQNYTSIQYFPATAAKQVQVQLPVQHQRRIRASRFASQYMPMSLSSSHNNPNMQNRKLDPPASISFAQSLELLHCTYIPMFPQQGHNLIPLTSSLLNSKAKTPYHPFISFE